MQHLHGLCVYKLSGWGAETSCRREAPVETVARLVSFLSVSLGFGTLFEADQAAWRQRLFECQVPIHTDHTLD